MDETQSLTRFIDALERLGKGDLTVRTEHPHDATERGLLAAAIDVLAEAMLVRDRHIEQVTGKARRVDRALRTLSASNRALLRVSDEAAQANELCRLIVQVGGHAFAWVGYAAPDQGKTIRPVAHFGGGEYFAGFAASCNDSVGGLAADAIRSGKPARRRNIVAEGNTVSGGERALEAQFKSGLALPLRVAGEIAGALVVYALDEDAFDDEEIALLGETADDLAFAIESLRTRQRQNQAEEAFRRASQHNETILESAGEGIYGTDCDGLITFVNPAAAAMLGYQRQELIGRRAHGTFHYHGPNLGAFPIENCPLCTCMAAAIAIQGKEETFWHKNGSPVPVEFSSVPLHEDGKLGGAVVTLRDISERKHYLEQLERKANFDDLTGLPNRNLLTDRLAQALARCRRQGGVLAVLALNLDRFREINDSLGREYGDDTLREVARRLCEGMRKADTIARVEGDGFILVIEINEPEEAASLARSILLLLARGFACGATEFCVNGSIGISVYPKDGELAESLLRNAAAAMYHVKASGGGSFGFFSGRMNASSLQRLTLENDLRRALEREELLLYYQPQLSLRSGEVIGAEALLRWNHPQRGMVPPLDFIPIAEENGLIVPIGEWVMRTACARNKAWQDAGLPAVTMAVNLSARQFSAQDVGRMTHEVLQQTGLSPGYLELELTESSVMADADSFIRATEELKALGVTLSIDDFGTGFSSLSYLKRFSLDRLKIDQSFVCNITVNPDDASIAMAVIAMAHSLKLSVIAEGVETQAQLNFLRARGCDEMQGYFFSKPLAADAFERLLRDGRKLAFSDGVDVPQNCILLVDDEPAMLSALKRVLRREGYTILTAANGLDGLEQLALHEVGVVVSDGRMPVMSGADFLGKVRELHPETVRVVLSGYTELKAVTDAVNKGEIFKFLTKPWDDAELVDTIRNAFAHYQSQHHSRAPAALS